jgi:acyl dehydratase
VPDSSHVGRTYAARGQVVDGERARAFASALAGDDAVDEPGAIAPTFAAVYMLFPTLGQIFGDPEVGIDLAGLIHGEQHFAWHAPVHAGDVIDSSARIASVQEKRGMTFVGVDLEAARQGQVVCSGSSVLIVRGAAS